MLRMKIVQSHTDNVSVRPIAIEFVYLCTNLSFVHSYHLSNDKCVYSTNSLSLVKAYRVHLRQAYANGLAAVRMLSRR